MIKDNIIGLIELVLNIDSYDINKRCNIKMDLKMKEQIDDNAAFNYQQEEEVDVDSMILQIGVMIVITTAMIVIKRVVQMMILHQN